MLRHISRIRGTWLNAFLFAASLSTFACTNDDTQVEEPVTEDIDTSTYPDDPDLDNPSTDIYGGGESDIANDESVGLTDDPFGADTGDHTGSFSGSDFDEAAAPDTGMAADDGIDAGADAWIDEGTTLTENDSSGDWSSNDSSSAQSSGGKEVRYVDAILLNVRARPSVRSKIVRRLLGGARVYVQTNVGGGYAKYKNGQYIKQKYLSSTPTKKVSRAEATRAWKKSRYKDTWRP